ncbi:MAG: hypothetical protein IJH90_09135 [Mogibacterium sp.]|nr:hypothetical protein [Mogibacterium sp.]
MGKFDEYLERAKDLAENAGDLAKNAAGNVVSRAKELTEEGGKVRELMESAKVQTSSFTTEAKEKVPGILKDARAVKEIRQGIAELEALPEFEGSILYKMELEAAVNNLNSLVLIIGDNRLDDESAAEEIRKTMVKMKLTADPEKAETIQEKSDEDQAIDQVNMIAYDACARALAVLNVSAE